MRTAAAYIRVSTDDQLEYSPDSQLLQIRRYAKDNGFLLPQQWVFVEEEGRSGRQSSKRPEFLRMIAAAKQSPKPFDAILVWKYSRFARSRQDSIVYKSMLRKELGIDVISVSEYLGDDKMAIITEAIIEAMDEFYSVNLAEEVTRGMAEKARRGQPLTYAPFGYRIEDKRYLPDPVTAPLVQMIFADFLAGMGYREIARSSTPCRCAPALATGWRAAASPTSCKTPSMQERFAGTPTANPSLSPPSSPTASTRRLSPRRTGTPHKGALPSSKACTRKRQSRLSGPAANLCCAGWCGAAAAAQRWSETPTACSATPMPAAGAPSPTRFRSRSSCAG